MHVIDNARYCWYCEILAPYLAPAGKYVAGVHVPGANPEAPNVLRQFIQAKFAQQPTCYRMGSIRSFDIAAPVLGPSGSADLVLTFRSVHNWERDG